MLNRPEGREGEGSGQVSVERVAVAGSNFHDGRYFAAVRACLSLQQLLASSLVQAPWQLAMGSRQGYIV